MDFEVKYRVKIPCYHYNTGSADNYSYTAKHDFETRGDNSQCTFYGRDRGEHNQQAVTVATLSELIERAKGSWVEYVYVFTNEHWYFTPLSAYGYAVYPNLKALVMELVMED